jgi:hypothetical protein
VFRTTLVLLPLLSLLPRVRLMAMTGKLVNCLGLRCQSDHIPLMIGEPTSGVYGAVLSVWFQPDTFKPSLP